MGTLDGFPYPPAMVRREQSSPAPQPCVRLLAGEAHVGVLFTNGCTDDFENRLTMGLHLELGGRAHSRFQLFDDQRYLNLIEEGVAKRIDEAQAWRTAILPVGKQLLRQVAIVENFVLDFSRFGLHAHVDSHGSSRLGMFGQVPSLYVRSANLARTHSAGQRAGTREKKRDFCATEGRAMPSARPRKPRKLGRDARCPCGTKAATVRQHAFARRFSSKHNRLSA